MSNSIIIPINHIERKPDSQKYRIIGKGVTVEFLATLINHPEWTVERICDNYHLTPAEVHSAWAFYYDHQEEIDAHLAEETSEFSTEDQEKYERVRAQYLEKTGKPYPNDL